MARIRCFIQQLLYICTYVVKTLLVYQRLVAVGSLKFLCFLSLTGIKPTQCVVLVLKRRNKQTSATICATLAVIYMLKVNLMAQLSRQQMEVLAPPSYSSLFVIFLALKILTHCIHNKSSKKTSTSCLYVCSSSARNKA
jgi:hypothetical protein